MERRRNCLPGEERDGCRKPCETVKESGSEKGQEKKLNVVSVQRDCQVGQQWQLLLNHQAVVYSVP